MRTSRPIGRSETRRRLLLVLGALLLVTAPLTAPLPGPGATVQSLAGLSLILRNSRPAQRLYVRLKARWPRLGGWCDWGLRRPSPRRRAALAREAGSS